MKKAVILIIASVLSLHSSVFASATERRDLTEFCELYAERITKSQSDYNIPVYSNVLPLPVEDRLFVSVTAGSLEVCKDNLQIIGASFTLYDNNVDDEKNDENRMSFIAAFSALEYSYEDDLLLTTKSKTIGGHKNSMVEATYLYNNELLPRINDGIKEISAGKENVLVYIGNYRYYLEYQQDASGGTIIDQYWINAEEVN